jgi:site-specific recombinase XerD
LKTEKSGNTVEVTTPILDELKKTLDAGPVGDLAFIVGKRGKPLTKESFGNMFKGACRAAGIDEDRKAAHGMRKVGATRCADAGATVHQLMSLFGWVTEHEALHYTKTANRRRLGREAAAKLATKRTPSEAARDAGVMPLKGRDTNGG